MKQDKQNRPLCIPEQYAQSVVFSLKINFCPRALRFEYFQASDSSEIEYCLRFQKHFGAELTIHKNLMTSYFAKKNTVEVVEKFVGLNKIWVQLKER